MYKLIYFHITGIFIFLSCILTPIFAQLDLEIQPSRIKGVAPLYVFFDVTSTAGLTNTNDLVNADFHWNFDLNDNDPNGDWETVKGMVVGHVFEEPGTYTIQCTVTSPDGNTDTETIIITVSEFSGTTYYVSSLGNDANDGLSESTAWQTANFAFSQLDSNERILFNRGNSFTNVNVHLQNLTGGKMIVGAYGSGNKPILSGEIDENRIIQLDFVNDIAFMDLHVIVNAPNIAGTNFGMESSSDVLLLNLELEGSTAMAVYNDDCNLIGVFDNYIHDFGVLATYAGDGTRLSWVGNTIDNLIGTPQPEHGMRIQGGEKQFIAHNTLSNLVETKSSIQIRGDGQRHVMIYKNKMDRILGINPVNVTSLADISYVTIEGNYIGQNPNYTIPPWENSINGINIEATNIAIRNNVIDGYRNAIFIGHDYNGVVSGFVDVYHNTVNWRPVSTESNNAGRIVRVRDVDNININNNFITAPTIAEGSVLVTQGTNNNIFVTNNVISTPVDYAVNPIPSSAAHLNDVSNYNILSNSVANNSGETGIPVFFDVNDTIRNVITPDVGAFEFSELLNIQTHNNIFVSIYPNPTSDFIYIKTNLLLEGLELYDVLGKSILKTKNTNKISINNLPKGIYVLKIYSVNKIVSKKIIIK